MTKRYNIFKIYSQYLADQQDGFVSNIDSYIEHTYKDLSRIQINNINKKIKKMIWLKMNYNKNEHNFNRQ